MVTINEVAKQAGVAKSTVSRYLNDGHISSHAKKKVEEAIKETGYTPNSFARSLKARKTNMIGVIIPRLNSASTNEVLEGIDLISQKYGYELIIINSNQEKERELKNIETLSTQKVEGIIMLAGEITSEHIELIKRKGIPFLFTGQKNNEIHSIAHQDYQAGRKIGEYALKLGHQYFLYVGVSEDDKAVGTERKRGFLDVVNKKSPSKVTVVESSFSRSDAYEKALIILPKTEATYIACATDNIAVAFLKAANDLGYSVPKDFSLSGFGGYDTTNYVTPSITTINYPYKRLGEEALEKIHKIINKESVPQLTELTNELVIKKSTKVKKYKL